LHSPHVKPKKTEGLTLRHVHDARFLGIQLHIEFHHLFKESGVHRIG
jgi:hypothetical protein